MFTAATGYKVNREFYELMLEQGHAFKQPATLHDGEILEFQLRIYLIQSL
jgi:hypothetical protein